MRLESAKATTRWVETDAEGRFTIPHAPDGRGSIVVDAGEAGWGSRPDVKLPLGEGKSLTITLALPASLDGKVVDDKTGRVVPRAKVFVKANGFARLMRTGPDGLYHLKGIPPQTYRFTVDEARYVSWLKPDLALNPGEVRRLDVAITLGATMIGKVVDENGAPVPAARGTLTRGGENAIAGIRRMLRVGGETTAFRTRADGTFKATRLAPGDNQRLFVSHADFERATLAGLSLPSGGTKGGVAIVMRRGATISGVVKDVNDQPIADVEVQVDPSVNFRAGAGGMIATFARIGGPSARPKTKTAADGTFHITGMSVGEYALQVRKPGFANERVDPVKVTDKGAEPVAVTLGPGAAIAGIVRRKNGEGAEGYMVRVGTGGRGAGGAGGPFAGTGTDLATGPDGLFVIDGLKPGQVYDLSVFGGVGLGPQKRGVVAPAANVDLVVAGTGRIAGTALDARSGQPLKNFSVSYEPDRGGGGAIIRLVARGAGVQTGIGQKRDVNTEDGTFALEDVPAGTWTVVVESKGYQQARVANLVVEENGSKDRVEVRATPGVVLKGRVTDARTGRPVANASITHEAAGSGGPGGFGGFGGRGGPLAGLDGGDDITSDAEGNFEIDGIGVGRLKVTAKNPDYTDGSEVADVKETGGTVEIKLTSGGSASGVVVAGNQPLPNAEVALSAAGDTGFGRILGGGQTTTTDATGRFRFDHLGAGRYSASAGMNGKSSNLAEFVLQAGDSKSDLVLSLSAGSTIQGTVSGLPDGWKAGATVMATGVQSFFANDEGRRRRQLLGHGRAGGARSRSARRRATASARRAARRSRSRRATTCPFSRRRSSSTSASRSAGTSRARASPSRTRWSSRTCRAAAAGRRRRAPTTAAATRSWACRKARTPSPPWAIRSPAAPAPRCGRPSRSRTTRTSTSRSRRRRSPAPSRTPTRSSRWPTPRSRSPRPQARGASRCSAWRRPTATGTSSSRTSCRRPTRSTRRRPTTSSTSAASRPPTTAATENLSIELARGQGIGIQVRDGIYGVPMRSVSARVLDGNQSAVFTGSIALDTSGVGEIPSLKPGSYALFVNASGYATGHPRERLGPVAAARAGHSHARRLRRHRRRPEVVRERHPARHAQDGGGRSLSVHALQHGRAHRDHGRRQRPDRLQAPREPRAGQLHPHARQRRRHDVQHRRGLASRRSRCRRRSAVKIRA